MKLYPSQSHNKSWGFGLQLIQVCMVNDMDPVFCSVLFRFVLTIRVQELISGIGWWAHLNWHSFEWAKFSCFQELTVQFYPNHLLVFAYLGPVTSNILQYLANLSHRIRITSFSFGLRIQNGSAWYRYKIVRLCQPWIFFFCINFDFWRYCIKIYLDYRVFQHPLHFASDSLSP